MRHTVLPARRRGQTQPRMTTRMQQCIGTGCEGYRVSNRLGTYLCMILILFISLLQLERVDEGRRDSRLEQEDPDEDEGRSSLVHVHLRSLSNIGSP